jgi:tetratricopeptide (TPR) repeat protein
MRMLKKPMLLAAIVALGMLDIFVYLNSRLYYRAEGVEDVRERIALLEKSNEFCPLNDHVFYELGKSYLDLGLANLGDPAASGASFRKSVKNLKKSILINPASPFSHFYLGQSLLNLGFFSASEEGRPYEEFRKSVLLAGDNSQINSEVGTLFLSRWPELSEGDRDFTLGALQRAMSKRDYRVVARVLNIWLLNVKDYQVMDKVLPSDARVYRQYAEFLGEKSLSLEERWKYLVQAEALEFEGAARKVQAGDIALSGLQTKEASGHFEAAQDLLTGIRFYQALRGENLITAADYTGLWRSTWLGLAKCRIEEGAGLNEIADMLSRYLAYEERTADVADLAAYLRNRGVLPDKLDKSSGDLKLLAFELLLQFKQNKYREIVNFGRELQSSFIVVPEEKKPDYVRLLQLVGDSLQKVDFLYDAGDIYQKAIEIDPNNLETLVKIQQNYDRLNEEKKLEDTRKAIDKLETPREIDFGSKRIIKGRAFSQPLVFERQKIVLDLRFSQFSGGQKTGAPLVSVFFNNRVVWEEYLKNGMISVELETSTGQNLLQITPVNEDVMLATLAYRPRNEETYTLGVRREN